MYYEIVGLWEKYFILFDLHGWKNCENVTQLLRQRYLLIAGNNNILPTHTSCYLKKYI